MTKDRFFADGCGLSVDGDTTCADQGFGFAPRGDSCAGEEFLQAFGLLCGEHHVVPLMLKDRRWRLGSLVLYQRGRLDGGRWLERTVGRIKKFGAFLLFFLFVSMGVGSWVCCVFVGVWISCIDGLFRGFGISCVTMGFSEVSGYLTP